MNFNRIQAAEVNLWELSAYFWNTSRILSRICSKPKETTYLKERQENKKEDKRKRQEKKKTIHMVKIFKKKYRFLSAQKSYKRIPLKTTR